MMCEDVQEWLKGSPTRIAEIRVGNDGRYRVSITDLDDDRKLKAFGTSSSCKAALHEALENYARAYCGAI